MDIKTLKYWHKLEHFYPYVLGEQTDSNIKTFTIESRDEFDELLNAPLPSGKAVRYYAVYLGLFRVDSALEALEEGMGRKMRFRDSGEDESCFCRFTMTANREFNSESFKISAFPWAIHRVWDGKITTDQWDADFGAFESGGFFRLRDHGEALDYDFLLGLRDWFAKKMNWGINYCAHWMRIDRVIGDIADKDNAADELGFEEDDDDVVGDIGAPTGSQAENMDTDEQVKQNDLLNSFYVRDLERMIERLEKNVPETGSCFQRYLAQGSDRKIDIEQDKDALVDLLSPHLLPKGKWPSDYGLRLMQQVDINAFLCDDPVYRQSLFSVNGPPGTGKTTLLKDIIAAIVVNRAVQMSGLGAPDDAFGDVVCEIKTPTGKGVYTNVVRDIKPEIKQYGILIASNNNGAVENITHTLPSLHEISADYLSEEYHYFSEVSDLLFGAGKTWALDAAALGNKRNQKRFIDAFWPINPKHVGYNFNKELSAQVKKRTPSDWTAAKQSFLNALDEARQAYAQAEQVYAHLKCLLAAKKELEMSQQKIQGGESRILLLHATLSEQESKIQELEQQRAHLRAKLDDIEASQPFFRFKWLFSSKAPLMEQYHLLEGELQTQMLELHQVRDAHFSAGQEIRQTQAMLQEQQTHADTLNREIVQAEEALDAFQKQTASPLRMDTYFEKEASEAANLSSPWGYEALNQCRARLFLEAMALHKAFVENSGHLRENLDAFGKMVRGMIQADQRPLAAPVLLQSLMLVVPVVSTTFASVGSFLCDIPEQEIAYLFVDEAGQATPQSAAGAVWRARQVIAVGDPLQIEPVVTLHDGVIDVLAGHYMQSEVIANKYTSVQSLADMANQLGGLRTVAEENDLWIGAPLVVHNRCQKRVFDIANRIAYNEKMIYATRERADAKCEWIHVSGNSQNGHYVPKQAQAIQNLVVEAFATFVEQKGETEKYPSIFVISPFRSVRSGMVAYFRKALPLLLEERSIDVSKDIVRKWISSCIGTIHTFQGKEADTVILCLGVDSNGKSIGAVEWACERPNILNVAVTRSKEKLFIVGDKTIWAEKPFFQTAFEMCQ